MSLNICVTVFVPPRNEEHDTRNMERKMGAKREAEQKHLQAERREQREEKKDVRRGEGGRQE